MRPSPSPLRSGLPHEVNVLTPKAQEMLRAALPHALATAVLIELRAKRASQETNDLPSRGAIAPH
ncbi:MAG: hypothetical protein ACK5EF_07030, partial [Bacteroidota bacterium]